MLGVKTITVNRYALAWDAAGQPVIGAPASTFTVRGSVQPLGDRVLVKLDEGTRLLARFAMYVKKGQPELHTAGKDSATLADFAVWHDREYAIYGDQDWTDHTPGIPHRSYVLVEIGQDEQP